MKLAVASVLLAVSSNVLAQVAEWGQCGGIGWTGGTTCAGGLACTYINDYYYQCLPGSSSAAAPPSSKTTSTSSNKPATSSSSVKTTSTTTTSSASGSTPTGKLPSSFKWSSSGVLVSPKSDSEAIAGIKDPSIIYYNGLYHVFASTAKEAGYNLVYFNFADFSSANSATFHYLDATPIGTGYRAAPQIFYFAPQKLWYLIYQNGNAAYSTNTDFTNPSGWSAPKTFWSSQPSIITSNIGSGYWVDMWVICDTANCYHFSSDDNGHLYRAQTTLANFPNGMSQPVIALSDSNKDNLFEASNVYSVAGEYFLIVECIGTDGHRYFRCWTAPSLTGTWTGLANSQSNPFAGSTNVAFSGTPWTKDISHGEMIRTNVDQTMSISACDMRYLYQGVNPSSTADYNSLPWTLGLLTQTNSPC